MAHRRVLVLSLTLLASLAGKAQYKAASITFTHLDGYATPDLLAVTGLHVGQTISTAELQAAAQRLIDTGYFDDLRLETKGTTPAMDITLVLKAQPPSRMTPVGFANFVWLTPAERDSAVHRGAPLFHGELPEAGNQPDLIAAALQQALAARGVVSKVSHEPLEPSLTQPARVIEFRVDTPIVLGTAALNGVPPELAGREQAVEKELKGTPYDEGMVGDSTLTRLLAPLVNAGYLEARLTDVQRTAAEAPGGAGREYAVALTATVVPGDVYHVGTLEYGGTEIAPASDVLAQAKLHTGDVASRQQLSLTEQPIELDYKRLGYMDVYVQSGETLDRAAHTVSYHLVPVPGEVYRVRSVMPTGLSPAAQREFDGAWLLKPGAVYNPEYVSHFIENNAALRALTAYAATFHAEADPATRLVDLTIKFLSGPR